VRLIVQKIYDNIKQDVVIKDQNFGSADDF